MYKLVIMMGQGPSQRTEYKTYWMTKAGLHEANEHFDKLTHNSKVMKLFLLRKDMEGTFELKRWARYDDG